MEKLKNKRKYINDFKNKSGITLIALVITIIILLLLSGVAIATLTGENGLMTRAKQAKKAQIEVEIKESLILAVQDLQVEKVGDATLDDITQEWIEEKLSEYNPNVKDDASINGKKITMQKNGITKKFLIDEELNITEIENDGEIQFSYEAISRNGDNVQILIKVSDTENGLSKIKCANGNVIECYGTKQEKGIDYTVQIGTEYKFKIISSSGTEQEETVLIDTYWHKITKNIAEGAKVDNPAIKAEYNKVYQANITTKDVLAEDGTIRTDAIYVIENIVVKMGEQEVTTSGNNIVDKATGKIYIEKVTGDIEINITVKKLEIQTTEAYIGPSSTETNSTKSVENNSQPKGTELYINFKATFGETNCTIKLKDDDTKTVPYKITYDGTYTFVVSTAYGTKNVTKEVTIKTEKYKIYKIYTSQDLQDMSKDMFGDYIIMNDIDMSGFEFVPISGYFQGTINGQGHTISNLTVKNENANNYNTAIFKYIRNVEIKNIIFKDVNISSVGSFVGVIAGDSYENAVFEKVGIIGNITSYGDIIGSYIAEVTGNIEFKNCYARTNIIAGEYDIGGFMGRSYGSVGIKVDNCYWVGTSSGKYRTGTFKAADNNSNQYINGMTITNSFYNKELFKLDVPEKISGKGLTTEEMKQQSSYTGWDFTNDWYMGPDGYPELKFNTEK